MSVYIEFIKKAFQQNYVYRLNLIMSIISSLLSLFVAISVWSALYRQNAVVNGVSFRDMINFVIINMAVNAFIHSNMGRKIASRVRDGSIAMDFIKPMNMKLYYFSDQIGDNLFYAIFNTLPVCIVAAVFLDFRLPDSIERLLLFAISIVCGFTIIFYINYILGLLAFWFKTAYYTDWFFNAFFSLLGGSVIPLWFYPKPLYFISSIFPFRFVSFEPISIYLGKYSLNSSLQIIFFQLVWIAVLILFEKLVWDRAQKLIVVHGG